MVSWQPVNNRYQSKYEQKFSSKVISQSPPALSLSLSLIPFFQELQEKYGVGYALLRKMGGANGEKEETVPVKATPQIEKGAGLGFVEEKNSKLDREVKDRGLLF